MNTFTPHGFHSHTVTAFSRSSSRPSSLYGIPIRWIHDLDELHEHEDVLLLHGAGMGRFLKDFSAVKAGQPSSVIVLAPCLDWDDVTLALQHGARGYLLENQYEAFLREALISAAHGGCVLDPVIAARQVRVAARARALARQRLELTQCERQLMNLVAAGLSVRAISKERSISERTVRSQLSSAYKKLQVHNRTEAILRWLGYAGPLGSNHRY